MYETSIAIEFPGCTRKIDSVSHPGIVVLGLFRNNYPAVAQVNDTSKESKRANTSITQSGVNLN